MNNEEIKIDKRHNNPGRQKGSMNYNTYKYLVTIYNKETNQIQSGKYFCLRHINQELNLTLTGEMLHRMHTHYRIDTSMKKGKNSFLAKYGHIKVERICEKVNL
tara:strand:+ start:97 stop:408 length:312 start_codon:yes stop_codon:yes gene_type:complete